MQNVLIEELVKDVSKEFRGGEKYFDNLDKRIKENRVIIYALIGEFMGSENGIVLSGEFGVNVATLIDEESLPISYILTVGSPRRGETLRIASTQGSADYYIFVDDSYFSGNTYRKIKDFLRETRNKFVSGVKVAYDGSKYFDENENLKSFYRFYDFHNENGEPL